jgi:repressor LexA
MVSDIMTLQEIANYLKVNKQTIYRMLNAKQIPAFRVRSEWRFQKSAIDEWIKKGQTIPSSGQASSVEIPIIGHIAAGTPILAEENLEGTLTVDSNLVKNPDKVFALKVHGESMINAGINDGDIILVRQQQIAENGEMVAVMIDNEATVKRFYKENGKIILKPENDNMKPIIVDPSDKNIRIAGKVEKVIKQKHSEITPDNLTKDEIFRQLKEHQDILKKYNVKRIGLFGSYARGEQTSTSDIDFIAEFDLSKFGENFKGLYKAFSELSDYLENLFKRKVEILTPESLSPYIQPYIEKEITWYETQPAVS